MTDDKILCCRECSDKPPHKLWMPELAKWLRGEAGRHMASMRVGKGAGPCSHALQLKLWADQLEAMAAHPGTPAMVPALERVGETLVCPECGKVYADVGEGEA